jgi:hypothetical protein
MTNQKAVRLTPYSITKNTLALLFFSAATLYAAQSLRAQTVSQNHKLATVTTIVNLFLLEEPTSLDLDLGRISTAPVVVTNSLEATFNHIGQDVELCFVIESPGFSVGDLILSINGQIQSGTARPRSGENCYLVPASQQEVRNTIQFSVPPGVSVRVSHAGIDPANLSRIGLSSLTRSGWNDRAVRKVLKIFAFGGHATDAQIKEWSYMHPREAISEMLNFNQHNAKLSPLSRGEKYRDVASSHGTMRAFYEFVGSESSNIPIPVSERQYLSIDGYRFDSTFARMIAVRGLNPFRQRIGFWETNYHLATNRDAGVSRQQMVQYYDEIMAAHQARRPYHEVLGVAAKSAAVAIQYGHYRNRWRTRNGESYCECNDDFAREIHQLFYGIFGANDPNHEDGTIRETAKMLTDMNVPYIQDFGRDIHVRFDTEEHHKADLTILGHTITGANARAKIDNLMPISIMHPESLRNLPIMIISTLADDNLNETRRNQLRAAWAQLGPNKDFLTFIHAYATSELFHGPDQFKYLTSFERAFYLANKFNIDNIEAYLSNDWVDGRAGREVDDVMEGDNASEIFRPLHNVFGGQNSTEASDSAVAFEKNYNRSATQEAWQFEQALPVDCEVCDLGQPWSKDWTKVIPARNGGYTADYVAEWLWRHVVGNFANYTSLERAHLVAILGARRLPREDGTEYDWQQNNRNTYFDINHLLCLRDDRVAQDYFNNSLADLMHFDTWNRFCDHGDDGQTDYTDIEKAAFAFSFNGQQLDSSNTDPFPYLRGLVEELAVSPVLLNSNDPITRRRANEHVQAALAFIFATPYVFAEGE